MESRVEQTDNVSRDELIMQQQREIEKEVNTCIHTFPFGSSNSAKFRIVMIYCCLFFRR